MKNCMGCKYAEWERTVVGRLHPNGEGRCTCPYKIPPLPASMYWIGSPSYGGCFIKRKETFKDHCSYYVRIESITGGEHHESL